MPEGLFLPKLFKLLLTFLLVFAATINAQDNAVGSSEHSSAEISTEIYVIRDIDFNIVGRTRAFALMHNGRFTQGVRIEGSENLERYIRDRIQDLNNQRVLDNSHTRIEYTLGAREADGTIPVNLVVYTRDSNNFVILPYPEYSTNDGFSITLKARDYNFLGTMTPLRFDLGYQLNQNDDHIFRFSFDIDMPFQAAGLNWNLIFDNNFTYEPDYPLNYDTRVGLSVNIPWWISTLTFGINQFLYINDDVSSDSRNYYGVNQNYYDPYFSTELFGAIRIPLGLEVGPYGQLSYTFRTSYRLYYPTISSDLPLRPTNSYSNTIGFGSTNWVGNFRRGLSASANVSNTIYINNNEAPFRTTLDFGINYHEHFANYFGISTRLRYRAFWRYSDRFDSYLYENTGSALRGIIDNELRATQILFLNFDFSSYVLRFWPSEWFNAPGLSFFNVEVHLTPFTDLALVKGSIRDSGASDPAYRQWRDIDFSFNDIVATAGLEVIIFSGFFRSLSLRGSLGFNLDKLKRDGLVLMGGFFPRWHEIYIGLDRAF